MNLILPDNTIIPPSSYCFFCFFLLMQCYRLHSHLDAYGIPSASTSRCLKRAHFLLFSGLSEEMHEHTCTGTCSSAPLRAKTLDHQGCDDDRGILQPRSQDHPNAGKLSWVVDWIIQQRCKSHLKLPSLMHCFLSAGHWTPGSLLVSVEPQALCASSPGPCSLCAKALGEAIFGHPWPSAGTRPSWPAEGLPGWVVLGAQDIYGFWAVWPHPCSLASGFLRWVGSAASSHITLAYSSSLLWSHCAPGQWFGARFWPSCLEVG